MTIYFLNCASSPLSLPNMDIPNIKLKTRGIKSIISKITQYFSMNSLKLPPDEFAGFVYGVKLPFE